jgi:hypothetical protein
MNRARDRDGEYGHGTTTACPVDRFVQRTTENRVRMRKKVLACSRVKRTKDEAGALSAMLGLCGQHADNRCCVLVETTLPCTRSCGYTASARMPMPIRGLNEHKICPVSRPFRDASEMDDVGKSGAWPAMQDCKNQ